MSVVVRNVDSTELRISFAGPFSQEQVSKVKKIKGRRWCPTEKYWAVPYSEETLRYLISIFADEDSAGLRVSEVVNLKIGDIDRHRMLIHVKEGKGHIFYVKSTKKQLIISHHCIEKIQILVI